MDSDSDLTPEAVDDLERKLERKSFRQRLTSAPEVVGLLLVLVAVGISHYRVMSELRSRVPTSTEDCLQSPACQEDGWCSFRTDLRRCEAIFDGDCEKSRACSEDKRCQALAGTCIAKR